MKTIWIETDRSDLSFLERVDVFSDAVILCRKASRWFDDDVPEILQELDNKGVKSHLAVNLCFAHYAHPDDNPYVTPPQFFDILDPSHRAHMVNSVAEIEQRYGRPIQLDYVRSGVAGYDEDFTYRNAMALLLHQIRKATSVELSVCTFPTFPILNPQYLAWGIDVERWFREGSIDWAFDMNYVYPGHDKWSDIHNRTRGAKELGRCYTLGGCYKKPSESMTAEEFESVIGALEAYDGYGIYPHQFFTDEHAEIMQRWR